MCALVWEEDGVAWQWRHRLWEWEEALLGECRILLHNIPMQVNVTDKWQWKLDPDDGYSVRGVYQLLNDQEFHSPEAILDLIWHNHVHVSVSILAWRLLRNRFPAKHNGVARSIIS